MPLHLPNSHEPQLAKALEYTLAHLASATCEEASASAAMSPRNSRRQFAAHMKISWREYVRKARVLRAMELLVRTELRITDVAAGVGFENPNAFSPAFTPLTCDSPRQYRRKRMRKPGTAR